MRTRLALLCFLPALALGAAGCGSESVSLDLVAAAAKTTDAGTARIAFSGSMSSPTLSAPITMSGSGVVDADARAETMSVTMSFPATPNVPAGDLTVDEISVGGFTYVRSDLPESLMPRGKSWTRHERDEWDNGFGLDMFMQSGPGPTAALDYLRGASPASEVGHDDVRGVDTTHYQFVIDLHDLATRSDSPEAIEKAIAEMGVSEFPSDAWIDAEGRIRRFRVSIGGIKIDGEEVEGTQTYEFFDFGVPAEIEAPPQEEVVIR